MPKNKIKNRRGSLFGIGPWSALFYILVAVLAPIVRSESWEHSLAEKLKSIGLMRIGDLWLGIFANSVVFAIGILAAMLGYREKISRQAERDAEIHLSGPKALFLRPFFIDKRFGVPNPFYSHLSGGIGPDAMFIKPEEFVGRVLEPYIIVMEIGGGRESVSGGRIYSSDDHWRESFAQAVEGAAVIVVLPMLGLNAKAGRILGEATIWEMRYLVESKNISRTIVVMPKVHWARRKYARQSWERARIATSSFGLFLPEYREQGAVMLFVKVLDAWKVERDFGGMKNGRYSLAAGLIEAVEWLSVKNNFALLKR
jgi:hypothetical protein